MTRIWIIVACAALSAGSDGYAQELRRVDPRERLEREVDEQTRQMREGKLVLTNVRVSVRLENGSRMTGIVKNGRFIEHHDGLSFVASDLSVRGAGLRLWYTDQTNGYVFLPYETIKGHSIGDVLSEDEVRAIGLRMEQLEQARRARAEGRRAASNVTDPVGVPPGLGPPGQPVDGPPDPAGTPSSEGPPREQKALSPEQKALLAEYPPSAGWGMEKLKKLERDRIVIRRYPNESEQRFMDSFEAWQVAVELQEEIEAAEQPGIGGAPPGSSPLPGIPPSVTPVPSPGPQPGGKRAPRGTPPEPPASQGRGRGSNRGDATGGPTGSRRG